MNLEQILKLGEIGFTKEEILKMAMANQEPDKEPEKEPEQEPEKEPEKDPEQESEQPEPDNESLSTGINALLQDMHKTLKGIQDANIKRSRMPEVETKKPEDILAEVIFPTYKKEGKE